MLCQNCNKNEATTHIKRIVNGEATENHLCSDCVKSLGYDDIFDSFNLKIPTLFSSFFRDTPFALSAAKSVRCECCGSSFDDIVKSGMVGCANCYSTFRDKLMPSIERIHGKTFHAGKTPVMHKTIEVPGDKKSNAQLIGEKSAELQEAIESQNFERAAVLRDEINKLREDM